MPGEESSEAPLLCWATKAAAFAASGRREKNGALPDGDRKLSLRPKPSIEPIDTAVNLILCIRSYIVAHKELNYDR